MASDLHARRFIVLLLAAAAALTAVIISPFWAALFLAAVVAAALRAPMEWLSGRLRGRRALAASLLTLAVLLVVLLPLAGFGALLVGQILNGVQWLREALQSEGIAGLVARLPGPAEHLAERALQALPDPQRQIQQLAGSQGGQAAAAVGGFLAATGGAVFQATMMLIALFFFLVDGQRLVEWLDARVPLRPGQFRELIDDFRRTSVSVLVATLATAGIQTATALVGYLIARAPNPIFLTFATFIVALIPAVGGTAMVVLVGLILLATGHVLAGVFLLAWGIVVVSLIDNVARPFLLKGGMELNGGVVFFALLGGLAVFGGIGLVIGPLVVTFLISTVRMYRREFGGPGSGGLGPDARAGAATRVDPDAPGALAPGSPAAAPGLTPRDVPGAPAKDA
jgi:predicted PurR-regulated permease PerM